MPSSYFADRMDHLGTRKEQLDSRTVRYIRGSNYVDIPASVSEPDTFDSMPNGTIITVTTRDYVIKASRLIINTQLTVPQEGDLIQDSNQKFQILRSGDDSLFKYTTQSRKRMRIHTKEVA